MEVAPALEWRRFFWFCSAQKMRRAAFISCFAGNFFVFVQGRLAGWKCGGWGGVEHEEGSGGARWRAPGRGFGAGIVESV